MNNRCQLKIVSWLILLVRAECSGSIGNYSVFLHKDTAQTYARGITVNFIWLEVIRLS
jgi:hypothetical protein